jgi:hypothetical protein
MARDLHLRLQALHHLVFSPLVEREIRAGARRPLFYWLRGLLAVAAGFQGYELLNRFIMAPPPSSGYPWAGSSTTFITGATLLHQMAWLLFLATLFMCLFTADTITRERREGTLGLLLLTDLTPREIVWGKMLSCGLTTFLVLLGAVPALMFPVLAGGVTGSEAALTGLGLLNTLFVVLAAGLWMSAVFQERRYAVPAALALVAALAFGPEVLGGSYFGMGAVPFFRLFGLDGWMTVAHMPGLFKLLFVLWFAVMHAVGWFCLWRAAATLAANWQDQPHKQVREPDPAEAWPTPAPAPPRLDATASQPEPATVLARASWLTDPRPWDADPIRWRVQRLGPVEGLLWLAIALNFLAQFGTVGSILNFGAGLTDTWGAVSFIGLTVILFSSALIAWAGARFFLDSRREQDFELLLTTPLGSRHILGGQWSVLRRAITWPVGVVLVVALPPALALGYDFTNGFRGEFWSLLQPFLICVNLAFETVALCWVGMWFGLHGRNAITALVGTVSLVQLLPLVLAASLMWVWRWHWGNLAGMTKSHGPMPPIILALLFFLVKNLSLIIWSRLSLRQELRIGRRADRRTASTRRLALQRA